MKFRRRIRVSLFGGTGLHTTARTLCIGHIISARAERDTSTGLVALPRLDATPPYGFVWNFVFRILYYTLLTHIDFFNRTK